MFAVRRPLATDVMTNAMLTGRRFVASVTKPLKARGRNHFGLSNRVENDGIRCNGKPELPAVLILKRFRRRVPRHVYSSTVV